MTQTTITLRKLTADAGHVLTNGEAYGKEIYLGKNDSPENWQELTDEQYGALLIEKAEKEEQNV